VATREYFPRRFGTAVRQRTRWVTGIALQTWERYGWRGNWRTRYWFWRDRKGLVASPLGLLTNAVFVAGMVDLIRSTAEHRPWTFAVNNPVVVALCFLTLLIQCFRILLRAFCVGRIFGWGFAMGVPLRVFHANLINCFASLRALWRYTKARIHKRPLVWLKTEHAYPTGDLLQLERRDLSEVLIACGLLTEQDLMGLQVDLGNEAGLADQLLALELISEDDLCHAISLQAGVPSTQIDVRRVKRHVVRSLPAHIEKRFGVMPFQVEQGRMLLAGTRVPPSSVFEELKRFTRLRIDFRLVTPGNYEQLRALL
jgi:adsorption protein B